MTPRHHLALLPLLYFVLPTLADLQCLALDNTTPSDSTIAPCNPSEDVSACCAINKDEPDICMAGGYCLSTNNEYAGVIFINGCTDWDADGRACSNICRGINGVTQVANLLPCPEYGTWCCRDASDTSDCCNDPSNSVSLSNFGLPIIGSSILPSSVTASICSDATASSGTIVAKATDRSSAAVTVTTTAGAALSETTDTGSGSESVPVDASCPSDRSTTVGAAVGAPLGAALVAALAGLLYMVKKNRDLKRGITPIMPVYGEAPVYAEAPGNARVEIMTEPHPVEIGYSKEERREGIHEGWS